MGERFPQERVRVFWRARLEGLSHEAVARAGVSVTAGREWVYATGGIPGDLDGGCGRYLSWAEREEIALGRAGG